MRDTWLLCSLILLEAAPHTQTNQFQYNVADFVRHAIAEGTPYNFVLYSLLSMTIYAKSDTLHKLLLLWFEQQKRHGFATACNGENRGVCIYKCIELGQQIKEEFCRILVRLCDSNKRSIILHKKL